MRVSKLFVSQCTCFKAVGHRHALELHRQWTACTIMGPGFSLHTEHVLAGPARPACSNLGAVSARGRRARIGRHARRAPGHHTQGRGHGRAGPRAHLSSRSARLSVPTSITIGSTADGLKPAAATYRSSLPARAHKFVSTQCCNAASAWVKAVLVN